MKQFIGVALVLVAGFAFAGDQPRISRGDEPNGGQNDPPVIPPCIINEMCGANGYTCVRQEGNLCCRMPDNTCWTAPMATPLIVPGGVVEGLAGIRVLTPLPGLAPGDFIIGIDGEPVDINVLPSRTRARLEYGASLTVARFSADFSAVTRTEGVMWQMKSSRGVPMMTGLYVLGVDGLEPRIVSWFEGEAVSRPIGVGDFLNDLGSRWEVVPAETFHIFSSEGFGLQVEER